MDATRPAVPGVAVGRWEAQGASSNGNREPCNRLQVAAGEVLSAIFSPWQKKQMDVWHQYWAPDLFFDAQSIVCTRGPSRQLARSPTTKNGAHIAQDGVDTAFEGEREELGASSSISLRWPGSCCATTAACGGFLVGLRAAAFAGLGQAMPPVIGVASAVLAASASASCAYAVGRPIARDVVELPALLTCSLACLCGALAPMPLVPVPEASFAGVAVQIRIALPGALGAIVMFELAHRHWARVHAGRVAELYEAEHRNAVGKELGRWQIGGLSAAFLESVQRHWWRHFSPLNQGDRGVGAIFLVAQLAVTGFAVHVDFALTSWRQTFFNALQAKDAVAFHQQLWEFLPIAAASTLASIYDGYLTTIWDLRWREELTTDFLNMWLPYRTRYRECAGGQASDGALDNIDQRLAEDTAVFASNSRSLICGAAAAAMRLAVFGPALIRLAPTPLVWQVCLGLSLASSALTHAVGHPLSARSAALQRAEADFRTALLRVRFFGHGGPAAGTGAGPDGADAASAFEGVKAAAWLAARGTLQLSTYTSAYSLVAGIFPFLVLVPSYFHGDITLGTMFQIEGIIGGVRQSLDFFIGAYSDIAVWRAATNRLLALEACAIGRTASQSERRDEGAVPDAIDDDTG